MMKNRSSQLALLWVAFMVASVIPSGADEAEVVSIRKAYESIESGRNWVKKVIEIPGDDPAEMVITRYEAKDGSLKKLVVKTIDDHGTGTERYYFSKGEVIFLFQEAQYWTFVWEIDENGEQRAKANATENGAVERRLYYADGKCVRHLLKERVGVNEKAALAALAKSANKAVDDPERAKLYQERGVMLAGIASRKELEALLGR